MKTTDDVGIQQVSFLAAVVILPLLAVFHLTLRASFGRDDDANRHVMQVDRLYLSTVETLAMAIDAKDDVTHSHVRRVQAYAVGALVSLLLVLMKLLPIIPGHFSGAEWIVLAVWIVLGMAFHRRGQRAVRG